MLCNRHFPNFVVIVDKIKSVVYEIKVEILPVIIILIEDLNLNLKQTRTETKLLKTKKYQIIQHEVY